MILVTYNRDSLKKHGVTRAQVQEAITDPMRITFEMSELNAELGNDFIKEETYRQMIVGHTYANVLLEIGIEMIAENALHIFHAQKVSPQYYRKYMKQLNNE